MKKLIFILGTGLAFAACAPSSSAPGISAASAQDSAVKTASVKPENLKTALFAGGCFWCIESDFEKLSGVVDVVSGYTGGRTDNPDYKTVSYTETGHYEAVKVTYDSSVIDYNGLLDYFWRHIDPTDPNGQFCDKGSSYRTAVFANEEQIATARKSKNDIAVSKPFDGPIVTEILPASTFFLAEEYHQDYYKKNPVHYRAYRTGCRRDARVKQLWGAEKASGYVSGDKKAKETKTYGSGK